MFPFCHYKLCLKANIFVLCSSQLCSLKSFVFFLLSPTSFFILFYFLQLSPPTQMLTAWHMFSIPFSMLKQWDYLHTHKGLVYLFDHLFINNRMLLHISSDLVSSIHEKPSTSSHRFFPRCGHPGVQGIWELSPSLSPIVTWRPWTEVIVPSDFYCPHLWNGSMLLPHLLYWITLSKFLSECIHIYTQ